MLMMKMSVYIIHIIYHTNYKGESYVREWVITDSSLELKYFS